MDLAPGEIKARPQNNERGATTAQARNQVIKKFAPA